MTIFNGNRIKQARELFGYTQEKLGELTGVSQATIAQVENGIYDGSNELIASIARITALPITFFSRETATSFSFGSLLFRAHRRIRRHEKLQAYQHARIGYEIFEHLRPTIKRSSNRVLRPQPDATISAAQKARIALGLKPGPVSHLLNHLEWSGVLVLVLPASNGCDAFSVWVDNTPLIAISTEKSGDDVRLTAAHEFGHLLLHSRQMTAHVDDAEADLFAMEFLMPSREFHDDFKGPVNLERLAEAKVKWRVPMRALLRRLHQLGLASERQFRYLTQQISAFGWTEQEPMIIPVERPRLLRQMVERTYGDPIDYQRLATSMDLPASMVERMLNDYAAAAQKERVTQRRPKVIVLPEQRYDPRKT